MFAILKMFDLISLSLDHNKITAMCIEPLGSEYVKTESLLSFKPKG